jgi:hypothetical protein
MESAATIAATQGVRVRALAVLSDELMVLGMVPSLERLIATSGRNAIVPGLPERGGSSSREEKRRRKLVCWTTDRAFV